jgi:hypothetical protein
VTKATRVTTFEWVSCHTLSRRHTGWKSSQARRLEKKRFPIRTLERQAASLPSEVYVDNGRYQGFPQDIGAHNKAVAPVYTTPSGRI